jgi:hypothetical protein
MMQEQEEADAAFDSTNNAFTIKTYSMEVQCARTQIKNWQAKKKSPVKITKLGKSPAK